MKLKFFATACMTGISQIFLQNNVLTGIFIVTGMFFSHWALGVSCFLGAALGNLFAILLKYNNKDIRLGRYGFNGSLAFMCVIHTFGLNKGAHTDAYYGIVWILGTVSAIAATFIMHLFIQHRKTAYTFPFVFTCWITCYLFAQIHLLGLEQTTPALENHTNTVDAMENPFFGWAEVDFGGNLINGILIFLGIAIANPSVAMWATAAAIFGDLTAYYTFNVDLNLLANGIYGFSSILVACAFAGNHFRDFLYVMAGIFLSVLIQHELGSITLIANGRWATYTIGFIVSGWIITGVKKYVASKTPANII